MGNLVFQATLGGQVNLVGPNTASTYNINVPAVAGNMVTTGDTGTVTNTMLAGSIANAKLANSSVTIGSTSVALGATSTTLDGVNIGATTAGTGAFTTLSASGNITASGGTANGVAYLNGSKVVTTGSALTFDGNALALTGATAQVVIPDSRSYLFGAGYSGITGNGANSSSGYIAFATSNSEKMRLDYSGNLGLGLTSSAWSFGKAIEFGFAGNALWNTGSAGQVNLLNNAYYNGAYKYGVTGYASYYQQNNGQHAWFNAPSGSAGASVTFTQAMTLDASGNLGVGVTSPTAKIEASSHIKTAGDFITTGGGYSARFGYQAFTSTGGFNIFTGDAVPLVFGTNATERARIDSSGNLLVGYATSNGAYKLQVNSQIFATSSTIATSDARYKENVQTLNGALDVVKALRPVQFSWKQHPVHAFDTTTPTVGFLAQEVQQVLADKPYLNSIVKTNQCVIEQEEKDEEGNVTKPAVTEDFLGIAEGNMISILTKAIQEQQALIQQLQADVAALKG